MTGSMPPRDNPRPLQFVLDGEVVSIPDPEPTMTVLQYLRDVAGRCGTKEGCEEGDCGACTVVLGERAADGNIHYSAVNSCIRFLPTLHGRELVTVEDLAGPDGPPHPVQQAMIDQHASQCGFCTPGFVMSLFGLYLNNPAPDRDAVLDALSGNLCRCTGYRPIIDAGLAMQAYAQPVRWSRADAQSAERRAQLEAIAAAPPQVPGYCAPRTVEELAARFIAAPDSLLLAGGTDIGLWVTQQLRQLPPLIWLGDVVELRQVRDDANGLTIGAAVTLSEAWPALLHHFPELAEQARRFASTPIRNSATLCGNLANGSPIGDGLPALLALDAVLALRRGDAARDLPLSEFYLDYRRTALARGEFITAVHVPPRHADDRVASYKIARRHDQDISAVSATFRVRVTQGRVVEARLAYGGMAGIAKRAAAAERALTGQPWTLAGIAAAQAALATDFQPMTDLRATGEYRLAVAAALLERFCRESSGEAVTLPATPVVVENAR
jgi:xanthine dehydrogenase small subunit